MRLEPLTQAGRQVLSAIIWLSSDLRVTFLKNESLLHPHPSKTYYDYQNGPT